VRSECRHCCLLVQDRRAVAADGQGQEDRADRVGSGAVGAEAVEREEASGPGAFLVVLPGLPGELLDSNLSLPGALLDSGPWAALESRHRSGLSCWRAHRMQAANTVLSLFHRRRS
jgi:hypothetical protein